MASQLPYKKRNFQDISSLIEQQYVQLHTVYEQLEPLDLSINKTDDDEKNQRINHVIQAARRLFRNENTTPSQSPSPLVTAARPVFRCNTCNHTFHLQERLRAHLRRHRIKESGRYACKQCPKTFVQQSSLITHRRIHTGERPYLCGDCGNRYGDLSTFTKHKRTHSGEKPYVCNLCNKSFSQSGNCLRHTRSVHRDDL